MAGFSGADDFVLGRLGRPSGVAGGRADDAFHVLEYGLDSPEASTGQAPRFACPGMEARGASCGAGIATAGLALALHAVAPRQMRAERQRP